MRAVLDRFYDVCGYLAGVFLIIIAVLIVWQAGARWLGVSAPGLSQYAGYSMAASSFLALAHTIKSGGHIRVMLVLQGLHGRARQLAEIWCLLAAASIAGYVAWFAVKMVMVSYDLGDVSEGYDRTPLWIPQSAMAFGASVLWLAIVDQLVMVLQGGTIDSRNRDAVLADE